MALATGVAPCLPWFLAAVAAVKAPAAWTGLYNYPWFISCGLSFTVYAARLRCAPSLGAEGIAGDWRKDVFGDGPSRSTNPARYVEPKVLSRPSLS